MQEKLQKRMGNDKLSSDNVNLQNIDLNDRDRYRNMDRSDRLSQQNKKGSSGSNKQQGGDFRMKNVIDLEKMEGLQKEEEIEEIHDEIIVNESKQVNVR